MKLIIKEVLLFNRTQQKDEVLAENLAESIGNAICQVLSQKGIFLKDSETLVERVQ